MKLVHGYLCINISFSMKLILKLRFQYIIKQVHTLDIMI